MEPIVTWVAPIATTVAALMTASNLGSRVTGWGFAVFTIGSLSWMMLGLATGQASLVWQNVILTGLNLFGIWRWLGRQVKLEKGAERVARDSETRPEETLFPVSLLTHARLFSSEKQELGTAVDALAGCQSGRLAFVAVASGGVSGVGETVRRVPWSSATVEGDEIHTSLARQEFEAFEPVAKDDWR